MNQSECDVCGTPVKTPSPTWKHHAAGRRSADTRDSTALNEMYNNSDHYYDHGDELLSEDLIIREAKARYELRMAKLHSHLAKENQIQNLVREVYRYEAKSMLLEERLKQEQLLVKELDSSHRKFRKSLDRGSSVSFDPQQTSTPYNTPSVNQSEYSGAEHTVKTLELEVKTLKQEINFLKEKNSKLKSITAGLIGKQLNLKDAKFNLLAVDLEEKDRNLKELQHTQAELLRIKDEEIEFLKSQLHQSLPLHLKDNSMLHSTSVVDDELYLWKRKCLLLEEELLKLKDDKDSYTLQRDSQLHSLQLEIDALRAHLNQPQHYSFFSHSNPYPNHGYAEANNTNGTSNGTGGEVHTDSNNSSEAPPIVDANQVGKINTYLPPKDRISNTLKALKAKGRSTVS